MRTRCVICAGVGTFRMNGLTLTCLDCKGRGTVDHCVACAGQKRCWLGGQDYLDPCPQCDGTGIHRSPRTYVTTHGLFHPAPASVVSAVQTS